MEKSEALLFKKGLRFDIGDVVFLKSDLKQKTPMVIHGFLSLSLSDMGDYVCACQNSRKELVKQFFWDKQLTQKTL